MTHLAKAEFHDDLSRFSISIESLHAVIHQGIAFTYSEVRTVANNSNNNTLIITGNKEPHFRYYVGSDRGPIEVYLFEDTTVTANGGTLVLFNVDRGASLTPTVSLFNTPTIAADGTQIDIGIIPGTTSNRTGAPRDLPFFEWILKENSIYMFRTRNVSGLAADININLFWYEIED